MAYTAATMELSTVVLNTITVWRLDDVTLFFLHQFELLVAMVTDL